MESGEGSWERAQQPQIRDTSLANANHLTKVLSESHNSYRHGYQRKLNLGRVHPIVLKRRRNPNFAPESPGRPSLKLHSFMRRPRSRRSRIKLSSILAIYIKTVSRIPTLGISTRLAKNALVEFTTHQIEFNAHSKEDRHFVALAKYGKNLLSQQDFLATELKSLQQITTHQEAVIPKEYLTYLRSQGYGFQDLAAWHWILAGETAEDAARRLEILMKPPIEVSFDFGLVPIFVLLRLLLRTDMSLRAFNILLRQSWQVLGSSDQHELQENPDATSRSTDTRRTLPSIGLDALVVLVARLLRHARHVWPAAVVEIAQLWIDHAGVGRIIERTKLDIITERDHTRLSFCYNRILSLLALPPNQAPFQSLHYRQRAQFMVIRQMNALDPSLVINREGYRAVTHVQLAHRKTHQERRWAKLKAKSWPPWKEDKLGVDAYISVEEGISRASNSLRQMAEAGYGSSDWEKAAGILAGWDTDHSPTYQTRSATIPRSSLYWAHKKPKDGPIPEGEAQKADADVTWAARIRATRTLQEAWTCFLICRDQDLPLTSLIYHAIFEKVIFEEKRNRSELYSEADGQAETEEKVLLPGDGKEVFESSTSQNQAISTREPLPTFGTLLSRMIDDQIKSSGRFLALLLNHARTFDEGVKILKASKLNETMKKALLLWREPPVLDVDTLLRSLPDWLFAAYVGFLCKFAHVRQREKSLTHQDHRAYSHETYATTLLLRHAFKLVIKRSPFYLPPWISLLKLLARAKSVVVIKKASLHPYGQAIPKYHKACRLIEHMDAIGLDLDLAGFKQFCKIFKNSVVSARHILATSDDDREKSGAQHHLQDELIFVKERFARIVQTTDIIDEERRPKAESNGLLSTITDETPPLPTLVCVPHPAYLHDYIRLLGQYPDHDSLMDLVRWMSTFSEQIMEEAKESSNGLTAMRTCLTAVRVFLEQPPKEVAGVETTVGEELEKYKVSLKRLEEVRKIIEANEVWDGWPTDEEVKYYLSLGEQRAI